MVYRIFVEKKPGLDHEAQALCADLRSLLGIEGLERLRIINRYDAENITPELFSYAVRAVFSEHLRLLMNSPIVFSLKYSTFTIAVSLTFIIAVIS